MEGTFILRGVAIKMTYGSACSIKLTLDSRNFNIEACLIHVKTVYVAFSRLISLNLLYGKNACEKCMLKKGACMKKCAC